MLPDLASMAGTRVEVVSSPLVAAGVAEHHRADARFHAAEAFIELYARGASTLRGAGVGRGGARAAAHLGVELLLDGCLSADRASGAFREALELGVRERAWSCSDPAGDRRVADALRRLADAGDVPDVYRDPPAVARRLSRMLARRPRLALDEPAEVAVRAWLEGARPAVAARADVLVASAASATP
jgi:hypothetical protein